MKKSEKYICVSAKEMVKDINVMERSYIGDDAQISFKHDRSIIIDEIFEKNGVDKNYRYIFIKVFNSKKMKNILTNKTPGYEFVSNTLFVLNGRKFEEGSCCYGESYTKEPYNYYNESEIKFLTVVDNTKNKDILNFFSSAEESGCLKAYVKSIIEIFGLKKYIQDRDFEKELYKKVLMIL